MKIREFLTLFALLIIVPCFSGCENQGLKKNRIDGCTYDFLQCTENKIEKSYTNHRAMIIKTTDNNNLPRPYYSAFYIIDLDPENEFPKESFNMRVIPCSDLPGKFRKDSLMVTVSGYQLSCRHVIQTFPYFRVAGMPVFNLKSIR